MGRKEYKFSSASKRILCRLLENILLGLISIGLFYLLSFWLVKNDKITNNSLFVTMLIINLIINFTLWNLYYIIIPYKFNGQTLLNRIFKIKLHWIQKENKLRKLFVKESIIWYPIYLSLIIFSLSLYSVNDIIFFFRNFIVMSNDHISIGDKVIIIIFKLVFIIVMLPVFILLINTIVKTNKKTYLDKLTNTCMIDLNEIKIKQVKNNDKFKQLPGIIENIDELE